jgi:flagellin
MTVINTNITALFAQSSLRTNNHNLNSAMEQLSTGQRINSAKDDAAGLAITTTMTSNIRGLTQAVRNANDGISLLQTAEGAMIEQTNILQRMRELSVQAASATYNDDQISYLDNEFQALNEQLNNIANQTSWNGDSLLNANSGSTQTATDSTFNFLVGSTGIEIVKVDVRNVTTGADGLGTESLKLDPLTTGSYQDAIDGVDEALKRISMARSKIGSGINQLTHVTDNLTNVIQNTTASRSQILDTDYAIATTKLASSQIIAQAATAMLAQANQSQQSVLSLLK